MKKYERLVEEGKIQPGNGNRAFTFPDTKGILVPPLVEAIVAIARAYKDAPTDLVYTMATNQVKSQKITATK